MALSEGQKQALRELRRIEGAGPAIEIVSVVDPDDFNDVRVTVSIDTRFPSTPTGIELRDREEIVLSIPTSFPWRVPKADVRHRRWARAAHVNWGQHLCLYVAPDVEWNPSDGMHGLIDRVLEFLRRAAIDDLDPIAAPLHPPAVFSSPDTPTAVIWTDVPEVQDQPWVGFAPIENPSARSIEVRQWLTTEDDWAYTDGNVAPVFLSHQKLAYEFPKRLGPLLTDLASHGVSKQRFLLLLRVAALRNAADTPLFVVIGTPMRGLRGVDERQHLAVWQIDSSHATSLRLSVPLEDDSDDLLELRGDLLTLMEQWADVTSVRWCPIDEARPEVTQRRDQDSPLAALQGKRITILGCGAIGSHLAVHLVRLGVKELHLVDNRTVTTGNLVRQTFIHDDLGLRKAVALRAHLLCIRPDLADYVHARDVDAHTLIDDRDSPVWSSEITIDATANAAIPKRLESAGAQLGPKPWLISLLLGHEGEKGMLTVVSPDTHLGPIGATRQIKLACLRAPHLTPYADEFWPVTPRTDLFVPEPGCSSPTFTGANADVAAMVSTLAREAALAISSGTPGVGTLVTLGSTESGPSSTRVELNEPIALTDAISNYQVAIEAAAHSEILRWIRRSERLAPGDETGGILFGEIDNATRTVNVTAAIGPPPDSTAAANGFICGSAGVADIAKRLVADSRGTHRPLGMWHTHPNGNPNASPTDLAGMTFLTHQNDQPLPQQLLLIAGGSPLGTAWNTYLFDRETKQWPPPTEQRRPIKPRPIGAIGLALSGGGLRAAAYHLGCLRALHDLQLLDNISVISGVSGGSIVTSMWAYSDDPFEVFEQRLLGLLRRGITRKILARSLRPGRLIRTMATTATAGVVSAPNAALGPGGPLRRASSITNALEECLTELIGDHRIADVRRSNLDVVLNACELRTGSAFRFGSAESGTWRDGLIKDNDVNVAQAVACSAAYPVVFPAVDFVAEFVQSDGTEAERRVILTDGGVYDNLGTSSLMPKRSSAHSTNVHSVNWVIACDAGRGLFDGKPRPYWMAGRMKRAFEAMYRRAQTLERGRLFDDAQATIGLDGFVVAMLGMEDNNLPLPVADLVPRETVIDIPTSFNGLSESAIRAVSDRGEQIMSSLCARYLSATRPWVD